jgi:MFS family permease
MSACQPADAAGMEQLSPRRIWALTVTNFAYGFMLADQGLILAPLEAERLFSERASLGLAALAVCCGLSQLVGPVAGNWTDQYRSRFGRRRPCLVIAFTMVAVLTCALWVCSELLWSGMFLCSFLLQQIAWNVLLSVSAGLVPDLVPAHQRGAAGGATAANTLGGALSALMMVHLVPSLQLNMHYLFTIALGAMCAVLVCAAADERSSLQCAKPLATPSGQEAVGGLLGFLHSFRSMYELDWRKYPDFSKLLLSKACYCASVMVKGFLMFFIQDTFRLSNVVEEQALVAETAIAAESTAALSALAAMMLLDSTVAQMRVEDPKTKKRMEMKGSDCEEVGEATVNPGFLRARQAAAVGSGWMGLLWWGPLLVGLGVLRAENALQIGDPSAVAIARTWMPYMVAGTGVWGLGQGVYLAGDAALGYALLPDPEQASRYLGLSSVCASFGAMFGGAMTGFLLYSLGGGGAAKAVSSSPHGHGAPGYEFPGYAAMFILASVLSGGCCSIISAIHPTADCERARMVTAP